MANSYMNITAEELAVMTPEKCNEIQEEIWDKFEQFREDGEPVPLASFKGFWSPPFFPCNWHKIQSFPVPENEIIVCSFPKSGTHWVSQMAYLVETQNFEKPLPKETRMLFDMSRPSIPARYDLLAKMPTPRFIFTHIAPTLVPDHFFNGRFIYVYRNPKDACVSFYHFTKGFSQKYIHFNDTFEEFARRFISGKVLFGPYPEHVKGYFNLKEKGRKMLILCYEDIKQDHRGAIRKIAEFLGKKLNEETIDKIAKATSFQDMRSNNNINWSEQKKQGLIKQNMEFCRKGEIGDWRNHFIDPQLLADFDKYIADNMPAELIAPDS